MLLAILCVIRLVEDLKWLLAALKRFCVLHVTTLVTPIEDTGFVIDWKVSAAGDVQDSCCARGLPSKPREVPYGKQPTCRFVTLEVIP